jgi:hypothetical protein
MVVRSNNKSFQRYRRLFWERAQTANGYRGMEDAAMLVFYLPIIILEAIFDVRQPTRLVSARAQDEEHASALGKASR